MADDNTLPETRPRPVVPMRDLAVPRPTTTYLQTRVGAPINPFTALQEANKDNEQLIARLQALCNKLAGDTPGFEHKNDATPPGGLMQLAAGVSHLISERSRHGVSLIDKIEEFLS